MTAPTGGPGQAPDEAILRFVRDSGLVPAGAAPRFSPLAGGVSSDIWLVEAAGRSFCVKRALERLKVAADWRAPVERSVYEAAWLRGVGRFAPEAVPALLADDPDAGMLAMDYLPPARYRNWKADLLAGRSDPEVARQVGGLLARVHAAFARDPGAPAGFPRDDIFYSIRLEPYLVATGRSHPALAGRMAKLVERTAATKLSVVHGDVSPKNILVGPAGPVFLDAECAWFGDPAFDTAFCLNHLLLKCLASRNAAGAHMAGFEALASAYLAGADWEDAGGLEERIATLLPALLLARVDGKSPVEYLAEGPERDSVRRVAIPLIERRPRSLAAVGEAWATGIGIGRTRA